MHQVGLVEQMLVQLDGLRILHQYMAGLADTGQQLVNGLGGIDHGLLGSGPVLAHGVVGAVERVKSGVGQPSFVKVDVVHVAVEHVLDSFGVVQHAVVGGLGQRQHPRPDGVGVDARQVLPH